MITRCKIGKGITGAVRYILGEGRDPESGELRFLAADELTRVDWIGGLNLGFEIESKADADLARRIMEFDALNQSSRTRRCEMDCVHLALAWRPGEEPTREQMEDTAQSALAAIGMCNASALFAAHNDEGYAHVHIVASKINPETGRAYDLKGNYLKLSRWAEAYESEHSGGIVCTRRQEANELRDAIEKRDAGAIVEADDPATRDLQGARPRPFARQADQGQGRARAHFRKEILARPEIVGLSDAPDGPVTSLHDDEHPRGRSVASCSAAESLTQDKRHSVDDAVRARGPWRKAFDGISREQARAFRHATGAAGLALIDGQAGTGKSYTMAAIRKAYEAQGDRVIGLAPTNAVAQDMGRTASTAPATVHSELFALKNGRAAWDARTVVMVDEAAMIDTKLMAELTTHARDAGAKLILVGDDRQLSSIDRGGMFGALKDRYGAAALTRGDAAAQERRPRAAASMMAEGNFHDALARLRSARAAITLDADAGGGARPRWSHNGRRTPPRRPDKTRFVFAYTNADVDGAQRRSARSAPAARRAWRGSSCCRRRTASERSPPATGCRFTGTDKKQGSTTAAAGTIAGNRWHAASRCGSTASRAATVDVRRGRVFRTSATAMPGRSTRGRGARSTRPISITRSTGARRRATSR